MEGKIVNRKTASKEKGKIFGLRRKLKSTQSNAQLPTKSTVFSEVEEIQKLAELEAIFKFAPVGLCILDRDLRHVRVNDFLAEINGLPVETHIGKTIQEVAPDFATKANNISKQILRTGKPVFDVEFCRTKPSELKIKKRWLGQWIPLKNHRDQIIGFIVAVKDITKQRQVEEALNEINRTLEKRVQEKTAELKRIIEDLQKTKTYLLQAHRIANLGTWEWDIRQNKLYWSDEVYHIFSVKRKNSRLNYNLFLSFIYPDDLDFIKKSVDSALKNKEKYSVEHRIIRKDGNEKFVKQRAEVVYDASDNPVRMVGTIQDITEDKKKEDRLYKQEKELSSRAELIDLAHDMIIVHNLDGKITFWNKGAEKTFGFKREEVLDKVTHEVLKTKYSEPLLKIISAVSTRGTWEGQMIHTTKNGKQIIVESRWALQKNEQGKPFAVIEIDRDISKRKSAEKKTEEARKYAESIIETIQEALVVLDAKLTVLSANNAFYRLFKLKPDQTEGKFIYELDQNQWDIPELRNFLEDILTKNTSFEAYEMDYLPLKGLTKVLSLNARRIYRGKKKTEMILLAMQDITTRKQQERRIRELTEELLFVEEEQRQAVATNLHDSIGQLLAFSKKEIAMILKEPKMRTDDSLKKILDSIQKSIEQSRKLTADLSSPTLHTFGLQAGLEELAEQFSNENEIKCSFRAAQENIRIEKKNELLLYRSVKELLCNIVKHAKAKSVKIELGISSSFLELKVVDDGKGFDVSHLNKNNTKKKSLGLFSIEQRLKNIGGSFNIESEKKKGTKVILRVPLKKT